MNRKPWTPRLDHALRTIIAEGGTRAEAAEELACSEPTVQRRARSLGLRFGPSSRPDVHRDSRVLALVAQGHDTTGRIAQAFAVTRQAAYKTVRRLVRAGLLERRGHRRLVVAWELSD